MDKLTRTLQATVITKSGDKTLGVKVERKQPHPLYGKVVRTHKKYLVHCEDTDNYEIGDEVVIAETRPISKRKSWKILNKLQTSKK